ncbi:hypothetical protein FQP85_22040 [Pseudoalteromonas neustonica]|uniref:Uncharacterized protein n=1 Tax=Pseudoalteromonas neustonica TaxID=1840331 RepID=A0ABY3F7R2_9GAMM|nr:hypothetical protein [Pseudoalteromonas neustonica]TVU79876.1 hypothetical protein FQP85_22040 [Pseudoalteromonas neustonica]
MAKSYEQDQKEFIRALKEILGSDYQAALLDAKAAKSAALEGISNPSPKQTWFAVAEGNRAMARHAKAHGVDSVPQYIKDQKEAAKGKYAQRNKSQSQNRQAAAMSTIKANPGNFTSRKVPANQGYSLNAEMDKTFKAARA